MTKETDAEAFVALWLDAWDGNRPEYLASFYAEDCAYVDPAVPEGLRGREALLRYLRRLCGAFPEMRWTSRGVLRLEDGGLVVRWDAVVPVNGKEVAFSGVDLLWLADGRIARNEVWFDRSAWLEAMRSEG